MATRKQAASRKKTTASTVKKRPAPERKLDIKEVLRAADLKRLNFYDRLSDDERKEINFFVLTRFLSSVSNEAGFDAQCLYLGIVNDTLNVHAKEMRHHPQLQWALATVVGLGVPVRHVWINASAGRKTKTAKKLDELIRSFHPAMKDDEIELFKSLNSRDDFVEMAMMLAWDDAQIKQMESEI